MEAYKPNRRITGEYDRGCAARCRNGIFVGRNRDGVVAFRGIPFAAPPVGTLRWKEPVPAAESDRVFEAFYNGPSPIQTKLESERASFYHQSEDCLYLNVWTAEGFAGQKRPVMVFVHGGNYGWGGTADPLYDGRNFVKAHPEIVLITIAYRIGLLGFMDFSEVPGGEEYPRSGNLGLLDQICALRYLRENLPSFGGDPANVTVFGESAGAGSVSLLPLIPEAKGLFSRVIAQSGSIALSYSREECLPLTRRLLKETNAGEMKDLLSLTEEEIMAVNEKLNENNNFPERDGVVLPVDLYAAYEHAGAHPVEMLIGTNADELRYWILDAGGLLPYRFLGRVLFGFTEKRLSGQDRQRAEAFLRMQAKKGVRGRLWQITEFFNDLLFRLPAIRQAEAHAAHGNRVFLYYWNYPSSIPNLRACHAVELAYVLNNLHATIYTGDGANQALAEQVQRMWVNFAKTGDPSADKVSWPPYSEASRNTVILDEPIRAEKDWKEREREFLSPLLAYCLNGNSVIPSVNPVSLLKATAITAGVRAKALLRRIFHKGRPGDGS